MGEILFSAIFGIVFIVISIILLCKEKYNASLILKYLASYMYVSLAYTTYTVTQTEHTTILFVGIALATIGDIAMGAHNVVNKYNSLINYCGLFLYIVENIIFSISLIKTSNVNPALGLISIIPTAIIIYLTIRKTKQSDILSIIFNSILIFSSFFTATLAITLLFNSTIVSNILFTIGTILIAISSSIHFINLNKENIIMTIINIASRYLGQLLITISMIFIYYI